MVMRTDFMAVVGVDIFSQGWVGKPDAVPISSASSSGTGREKHVKRAVGYGSTSETQPTDLFSGGFAWTKVTEELI